MLRRPLHSVHFVIMTLLFLGTLSAQNLPNNESREPAGKQSGLNLPTEFEANDRDLQYETFREGIMVVALKADSALYREEHRISSGKNASITETAVAKNELPKLLKPFFADKAPDKRVVYLKADRNTAFENVIHFFDSIREAEIDRVVLIVIDQNIAKNLNAGGFEVKLTSKPFRDKPPGMPERLKLVVALAADGSVALNGVPHGQLSDIEKMADSLRGVFHTREQKKEFRKGTQEIEKTVFLKASRSNRYADIIKVVSAVKSAGSHPIGVQIDYVD